LIPVWGALGLFLAMKYELKEASTAGDTMPSLVAVLDTNFWLATHVTTITLGYSAGLVAAFLGMRWIVSRILGLRRGDKEHYRALTRMIYGVVCFGLFFSVVGTILGGVWANYSWGRFWGWDPKENGALLICLAEIMILHLRMGGYIRDFGLAVMSVANGTVVAFSWFGVNLLNVGLHTYGFTSGIALALNLYYGLSALIVLAAFVWSALSRRDEKAGGEAATSQV
jgi:ABC-type transport system involved in cytochrome c biogenesis permease subunit